VGTAEADYLYGRDGNDILSGKGGDDHIHSGNGDDTLDGGAGSDRLDGGTGNNVYQFGRGDGQDIVAPVHDATVGKLNTLQFKEGVLPSEVVARRVYDSGYESLELSIAGTTDSITVRNFFSGDDPENAYNPVQQVRFADGTVWDIAAIVSRAFAGTAAADSITGTSGDDVINGQAGADVIDGGHGDDTLSGGADADALSGGNGDDTLDGGAGSDTLNGGTGNNVYQFGRGDGQDIVELVRDTTAGKLNTLQFKEGVLPSEVVVRRVYDFSYQSLELSIAGTTDTITVRYAFFYGNGPTNADNPVQQVRFTDGTVWDMETIMARIPDGTVVINGSTGSTRTNTARRGESNDMPQGQGADDARGGDESRASTEGATDKPATDGTLHESDPANDDIATQCPLTDGGILDITEILARLGNAIHGSKSSNGATGNGMPSAPGEHDHLYLRDAVADSASACGTTADPPWPGGAGPELGLVGVPDSMGSSAWLL